MEQFPEHIRVHRRLLRPHIPDFFAQRIGHKLKVLAFQHVACVIPGFRNERQVRVNLGAEGRPLSPEDVAFVREALD